METVNTFEMNSFQNTPRERRHPQQGRHCSEEDQCKEMLTSPGLLHKSTGQFDSGHDNIKVMSLHAIKGLEFPVLGMVGVGHMPTEGEDERLFYVGAAQKLVIGVGGGGKFSARI